MQSRFNNPVPAISPRVWLLASTALLLLSCGGGGSSSSTSSNPPPAGNVISVGSGGFLFSPANLTAKVGSKVTFSWAAGGHSVVVGTACTPGGPITLDTGIHSAGFSADVTMPNVPGDVPFYCQPHCGLGMTGVIHVTQ
ncbi:MAG: hypothetical protein IPP78_02970 [Holophagaceae bacterium]|nr:hypothetical protein [Holophagaceae bacterium]